MAVVVPERKVLEDWGVNNQEKGDFEFLCNNTKARKYIMEELNKTAKQHNVSLLRYNSMTIDIMPTFYFCLFIST